MIFQNKQRAIKFLESNGCDPVNGNSKLYKKEGYFKVPKGHRTRPYYSLAKYKQGWKVYKNYLTLNGSLKTEELECDDKV